MGGLRGRRLPVSDARNCDVLGGMVRLRTVSPSSPGWTRRRSGSGFTYLDEDGRRLDAPRVERIKALVIPPAWQDVWICPLPNGHI